MKLQEKRVLIVLHEGALGGAERQALGLAKYLTTEKKCYVDLLLTFSKDTTVEFDDFMKECGISNLIYVENPYLFFNSEFTIKNVKRLKWSIEYLYQLRKKLKPNKYDILIPYLNNTSKISYYIYKLLPTVKFTFWHQLGLDVLVYDYFEKHAAYNIPCVIGNASNCFDIFKKDYVLPEYKLNLLPQYITLNKVLKDKTLLKKQFNIDENKIVIGMIAHFRVDKYQELLITVFAKLIKSFPNIHLVILGNRKNSDACNDKFLSLQKLIKENSIIDNTTLLSNVDVTDVLNILDIGVLVSMIEGTPNSVMEYMLYGMPVVASDHPGCIGLLRESPFLVKNDVDIIYNKLSLLIESDDLRIQEGNKNLERIKEYDLPGYVEKLEKIITKYSKHE
ncbi:MAG: glycosyltransferase family 4 protein [Flavobacterium sp.]|uniref:glycosyltransferase family 4 protein n=1 Tax=Flavobacterium sp. TaxID=239 RepID=UPI0022C4D74D|nr:glycosyltransferase family 4 protein [Flavobacterium sp.]MCZ8197296.1 glycosyltransferase family 4 protein [Flavobacterium sp.]